MGRKEKKEGRKRRKEGEERNKKVVQGLEAGDSGSE